MCLVIFYCYDLLNRGEGLCNFRISHDFLRKMVALKKAVLFPFLERGDMFCKIKKTTVPP